MEVVVRSPTVAAKHPQDVSVLEDSGNVYISCVFRYDFGLHDSLEVLWMFNNGTATSRLATATGGTGGRVSNLGYEGRATLLHHPYNKQSHSYQTLTIQASVSASHWTRFSANQTKGLF